MICRNRSCCILLLVSLLRSAGFASSDENRLFFNKKKKSDKMSGETRQQEVKCYNSNFPWKWWELEHTSVSCFRFKLAAFHFDSFVFAPLTVWPNSYQSSCSVTAATAGGCLLESSGVAATCPPSSCVFDTLTGTNLIGSRETQLP